MSTVQEPSTTNEPRLVKGDKTRKRMTIFRASEARAAQDHIALDRYRRQRAGWHTDPG